MLVININGGGGAAIISRSLFSDGGGVSGWSFSFMSRSRSSSSSSSSRRQQQQQQQQRRRLSLLSTSCSQQQSIMQGPWLMLSSPTNPQSRLFFDPIIQQQQQQQDDSLTIRLNREIHLPDISGHQCFGSSEGFLITYDSTSEDRPPQLCATNPLTGSHLPTFLSAHPFSQSYAPGIYLSLFKSKAILSPSLDTVVLLCERFLTFAPLGEGEDWYSIDDRSNFMVEDCIFHEGRLHYVDADGFLYILDLEDPSPSFTSPEGPVALEYASSSLKKCYIVESPDGDDLFLVYRQKYCPLDDFYDDQLDPLICDQETSRKKNLFGYANTKKNFGLPVKRSKLFKVFKFDKKNNYKLDQVDRVGDFAIFVGPNRSTALSVRDFPTLKPNSIYFTDDFREGCYRKPELIGDTGVFNLEDGSIKYFKLTTDDGLQKLNHLPPIWFIPPKLSAASSEIE